MSISMLKQNIELLIEISKKYHELVTRRGVISSSTELKNIKEALEKFKIYIKFLTANIEQLIREEESVLK